MKTLPKYFIILRDATNPLWDKYIQWLRTTYNAPWTGVLDEYYGHDDTKTLTHCHKRPDQFLNNPTIITLDYWNECVNGFQLPEFWYVVVNKDNLTSLSKWRFDEHDLKLSVGQVVGWCRTSWSGFIGSKEHSNKNIDADFGQEITFEQFKQYVLKQEPLKEETMKKYTINEIKTNQKLVVFIETKEQFEKIVKYVGKFVIQFYGQYCYSIKGGTYSSNSTKTNSGSYGNVTIVYFDEIDFMDGEKKVIGYRLAKKEMYAAASQIIFGNTLGCSQMEGDNYLSNKEDSTTIKRLKNAGVLDLWFEPVYEDNLESMVKEFTAKTGIKVGDTILAPCKISGTNCWDSSSEVWRDSNAHNNREVRRFSIHPNGTLLMQVSGTISDIWFDAYKMKLVPSTPDIIIRGYKAIFTKDSVTFGCQTYTKEFVLKLAKCLEDNDFEMEIKDEIFEIAEYFKSLD